MPGKLLIPIAALLWTSSAAYGQFPQIAAPPATATAVSESPENPPPAVDCPSFGLASGAYVAADKVVAIFIGNGYGLETEPVDGYCTAGKSVVASFSNFYGSPYHNPTRRCPVAHFVNKILGDFLCARYQVESKQTIDDIRSLSGRLDALEAQKQTTIDDIRSLSGRLDALEAQKQTPQH